MKVTVRFSCPEVLGNMRNGEYEVPENATVRQLLSICAAENNVTVRDEHLKWLLVVVNGRQSGWDGALTDGCKVLFLRGALGG